MQNEFYVIGADVAEGKIDGKIEESNHIALNMLNEGIDLSIITKCTGLSKKEIEKLK